MNNRIKSKVGCCYLIMIISLMLAKPAGAKSADGIAFDPSYRDQGLVMNLRGQGTKRILFKEIFIAGLYLDESTHHQEVLDDVPKRIEISYFTHVEADQFAKYIRKRMKKSMNGDEFSKVEPRIDEMDTYFVDLKPGDFFSMTYIPQVGTKFECNDKLLGIVEGADFGKGIFATWVGEKPFDKTVKKQVLGLQ